MNLLHSILNKKTAYEHRKNLGAELAKENSEASTDFIDPKNANKILNTCMEYANGGIRGLKRLMENSTSNYFEGFENELDEVLEYYDKINTDQ